MPTYDLTDRFRRDLDRLTAADRALFRQAVAAFVSDLATGRFRKGLRVKAVEGSRGVWELTWANDGRATFEYGPPLSPGEPHVIWRRIGTHDIFKRP